MLSLSRYHWFRSQRRTFAVLRECLLCALVYLCVFLCLIVVSHTCVRLLVPFVFSACMINACGLSHTSTDTQQQHFNTQHRTQNIAFQLRTSMDSFAYSPTFSDYIRRMAFFARLDVLTRDIHMDYFVFGSSVFVRHSDILFRHFSLALCFFISFRFHTHTLDCSVAFEW